MASTSLSGPSHSQNPPWPSETISPVGYLSRKALPIKRNDAEPLTREDVQFDLLDHIFADSNPVFTSPNRNKKIRFSELYIDALYSSSKCSKVLKDKMTDTPDFAVELAKISLLTNVGRINTTMAFFPEMKTALRTYHPVPSLQKTDGNAQDAPRIKNCLKAALLPSELKTNPPTTPEEILAKRQTGERPPTSVVNLIFVLANHAAPLAPVHFDGVLNFLDLFLPKKGLSSTDRARVFLWHLYHYLEDPESPNPWDDDYSRANPPKAPQIRYLTEREISMENVDTPEEIDWGQKMTRQRNRFLQQLVSSLEYGKKKDLTMPHFVPGKVAVLPYSGGDPDMAISRSRSSRHTREDVGFMFYVPGQGQSAGSSASRNPPLPAQSSSSPPPLSVLPQTSSFSNELPSQHTHTSLYQTQASLDGPPGQRQPITARRHREVRNMLQQAWHIVNTVDPLADSDGEMDEHIRQDYTRRLNILNRIRNKLLTAEPPFRPPVSSQHPHQQHHHRHSQRSFHSQRSQVRSHYGGQGTHDHPQSHHRDRVESAHTPHPRHRRETARHFQHRRSYSYGRDTDPPYGLDDTQFTAPSLIFHQSHSSNTNTSSGPMPVSSTSSASLSASAPIPRQDSVRSPESTNTTSRHFIRHPRSLVGRK